MEKSELGQYILRQTRGVNAALGWSTMQEVADIIDDVLLDYGVPTVEAAIDLRKLRILARYFAWRAAVEQLAGKIPVTIAGNTWNRDRLQAQAKEALTIAKDEAAIYLRQAVDGEDTDLNTVQVAYIGPTRLDPYRSAR